MNSFSGIPALSAKCFTEDYLFHLGIKGNNMQYVFYVSSMFCSATNSLLCCTQWSRRLPHVCERRTCALAKLAKTQEMLFFFFLSVFVSFRVMEIFLFFILHCLVWLFKVCISLDCWHIYLFWNAIYDVFLSLFWITEEPNSIYYCIHKISKISH